MPERIQLSRRRGWRKPEGAIVVARPTRWGNPWRVVPVSHPSFTGGKGEGVVHADGNRHAGSFEHGRGRYWAVQMFKLHLQETPGLYDAVRIELAGHDLACWCPLFRVPRRRPA